jgi:hypothetical protein
VIAKAITTIDNPFDPFDEFDDWYAFDESKGYHSCSYLARIAKTSSSLSDEENQRLVNQAVDDIVRLNINGMYKKVVKEY